MLPPQTPGLCGAARNPSVDAFRSCSRAWQIRFESVGLAGVEKGFEICAGPRSMCLYGIAPLDHHGGLPELPDVDFAMAGRARATSGAVLAFAGLLRQAVTS